MIQTPPNAADPRINWNPVGGTPLPPTWSQGPPGPPGPPGPRGSYWWEGAGFPSGGLAAQSQDLYLDNLTGDVYVFS